MFENQGQNDSYSIFADVTYLATDSLELTAGLRYLWEDRQSGYRTDVPNSVLSGAPLIPGQIDTGGQTFTAEDSFDAWLPRFNVLYRISPEVNVFATVSKGRRSPVVQLSAARDTTGAVVPGLQSVPEETVWNYEGPAGQRPGLGSLGVYYQVYDNLVSVEELDANGNPTGGFVTESAQGPRPISASRRRSRSRQRTGRASLPMSVTSTAGSTKTTASHPSFPVPGSACSPSGRPRPASPWIIRWAMVHACSPRQASRTAAGSISKCPTAT